MEDNNEEEEEEEETAVFFMTLFHVRIPRTEFQIF